MTRGRVWLFVIIALLLVAGAVATTLIVVSPVALQPNAAPWWGIPIFTLTGGVGGALIAGFFVLKAETSRWERQTLSESAQMVRDISAEVLELVGKKLIAVTPNSWTPEQEGEMWSAINRLTLVAPTHISDCALELGEEINEIYSEFRTEWVKNSDSEGFVAKRGAFIKAVIDEYLPTDSKASTRFAF
jgi:hypothetical protein